LLQTGLHEQAAKPSLCKLADFELFQFVHYESFTCSSFYLGVELTMIWMAMYSLVFTVCPYS